jgi:putative zinc finger protein
MKTERCREWRESLGAYALGHLPPEERVSLEAHLEGCSECRAEAASLALVSRLLPHADPERFGPAPLPPAALGERIAARIGAERRRTRRRQLRLGLGLGGATAAAAAVLAIFVLPGGGDGAPAQHVSFGALPPGMKIGAKLEPRAFGTEIHVYVKGAPSGALCRVFLRGRNGSRLSAGSFRYRWGDDSQAVLSSALDLSRTSAIGVRVGNRTFVAPVGNPDSATTGPNQAQEEKT